MLATLPLLEVTDFPAMKRSRLETLQVNLGYLCNQQCLHCHVDAGPKRTEIMDRETIDQVLAYIDASGVTTLDLTGGAPEMNPHFRYLVSEARQRDVHVMDRCNLTVLALEDQTDLAQFLADHQVEVIASMPCYLEDNVNKQRGKGVFDESITGLQQLNQLGYGQAESGLALNLVYNPQGPELPPAQESLQADYKKVLGDNFGIVFNDLYTLANMPIKRFGSTLISKGQFVDYMKLLRDNYSEANKDGVMCLSLLSVDWQGYVYDCDFNQQLALPMSLKGIARPHLMDIMARDLQGLPIVVKDHCYGCTAGQGSSCGGSLSTDS